MTWIVDGQKLTPSALFTKATALGFNGTKNTIKSRLHAGVNTMAELAKPVNTNLRGGRSRIGHFEKSRDECAAAMAAVDARRKEMMS